MRYIAELEQKVQILQSEATNLSAQLTMMQVTRTDPFAFPLSRAIAVSSS
jgi:uncharacterized small protein (DUF1192 family)